MAWRNRRGDFGGVTGGRNGGELNEDRRGVMAAALSASSASQQQP